MAGFITRGVGIDISEHHIRMVKMSVFGLVKELFEVTLPEGLIVDGKVVEAEKVKEILKKNLAGSPMSHGQMPATLLIPDSRIFYSTFLIAGKVSDEASSRQAVTKAQREIPLPFSLARVRVSQGMSTDEGIFTNVSVIEEDVIKGFEDILSVTPFRLVSIEANSRAVYRLLCQFVKLKKNEAIIVIDVGALWATASVYSKKGSCLFSRSIACNSHGKETLGKKDLSVDNVAKIGGIIQEILVYFKDRQEVEIDSIVFSGVEAQCEKINKLAKDLSKEGMFAKQISDIVSFKGLTKQQVHVYGASIGGAVRSILYRANRYQHNFLNLSK